MTKEIQLTQGKVALVDDEDYEWLSQWKWCFTCGYAHRKDNGKTSWMHRAIAKHYRPLESEEEIDHINRNKLDNRKQNLRVVNRKQNMLNKDLQSNNTSGHTGVSWMRQFNKWRAYIVVSQKQIHLGVFDNIEDAVYARELAYQKHFGETGYV